MNETHVANELSQTGDYCTCAFYYGSADIDETKLFESLMKLDDSIPFPMDDIAGNMTDFDFADGNGTESPNYIKMMGTVRAVLILIQL